MLHGKVSSQAHCWSPHTHTNTHTYYPAYRFQHIYKYTGNPNKYINNKQLLPLAHGFVWEYLCIFKLPLEAPGRLVIWGELYTLHSWIQPHKREWIRVFDRVNQISCNIDLCIAMFQTLLCNDVHKTQVPEVIILRFLWNIKETLQTGGGSAVTSVCFGPIRQPIKKAAQWSSNKCWCLMTANNNISTSCASFLSLVFFFLSFCLSGPKLDKEREKSQSNDKVQGHVLN